MYLALFLSVLGLFYMLQHPISLVKQVSVGKFSIIKGRLTKLLLKPGDDLTYPAFNDTLSILYTLHIDGVFFEEVQSRTDPFVTRIGVKKVIDGWYIFTHSH